MCEKCVDVKDAINFEEVSANLMDVLLKSVPDGLDAEGKRVHMTLVMAHFISYSASLMKRMGVSLDYVGHSFYQFGW